MEDRIREWLKPQSYVGFMDDEEKPLDDVILDGTFDLKDLADQILQVVKEFERDIWAEAYNKGGYDNLKLNEEPPISIQGAIHDVENGACSAEEGIKMIKSYLSPKEK